LGVHEACKVRFCKEARLGKLVPSEKDFKTCSEHRAGFFVVHFLATFSKPMRILN